MAHHTARRPPPLVLWWRPDVDSEWKKLKKVPIRSQCFLGRDDFETDDRRISRKQLSILSEDGITSTITNEGHNHSYIMPKTENSEEPLLLQSRSSQTVSLHQVVEAVRFGPQITLRAAETRQTLSDDDEVVVVGTKRAGQALDDEQSPTRIRVDLDLETTDRVIARGESSSESVQLGTTYQGHVSDRCSRPGSPRSDYWTPVRSPSSGSTPPPYSSYWSDRAWERYGETSAAGAKRGKRLEKMRLKKLRQRGGSRQYSPPASPPAFNSDNDSVKVPFGSSQIVPRTSPVPGLEDNTRSAAPQNFSSDIHNARELNAPMAVLVTDNERSTKRKREDDNDTISAPTPRTRKPPALEVQHVSPPTSPLSSPSKSATPTKASPPKPAAPTGRGTNLFEGCCVYFLCKGADLTVKRVKLLRSRVAEKGGKAVVEFNDEVTHAFFSTKFDMSSALEALRLKTKPSGVSFHYVDWISESLKMGKRLSDADFCLRRPQTVRVTAPSASPDSKSVSPSKIENKLRRGAERWEDERSPRRYENDEEVDERSRKSPKRQLFDDKAEVESEPLSQTNGDPADPKDPFSKVKRNTYIDKQRDKFACQQSIALKGESGPNDFLIAEFEKLVRIYEATGEVWRVYTTKRAITTLKNLTYKITSGAEARKLNGFGAKLCDKVDEINHCGFLERVRNMEAQPEVQATELFTTIYGVGPSTAQKWVNRGWRTIEDVWNNVDKLSQNQTIGLKYREDLLLKIPREEVATVEEIVRGVVDSCCQGLELTVCGSYRRRKSECGDVDILITKPDDGNEGLLSKIVTELKRVGILTDDLSVSLGNEEEHEGCETYMGIYQLNPSLPHRRIDIKLYPKAIYPFAILYFTGSGHFNRSMRLFAQKKGLSMSDKGLYPVTRRGREKETKGDPIECSSERQIFEVLGLEYKEPWERNV